MHARTATRRSGLLLAVLFLGPIAHARATTLSVSDIFSQFDVVTFGDFTSGADVEGRAVVGGNLTGGATIFNNPGNAAASSYSALTVYGSATSTGSVNVLNGGSAIIVGDNKTTLGVTGTTTVIGGKNSGSVTAAGGTVYLGSNSGSVQVNGTANVDLNGANTGTIGTSGGNIYYTGNSAGSGNQNNTTATKVASVSNPASTLANFATTFETPLKDLSTQLGKLASNSSATTTVINGTNTTALNAAPDNTGTAVFNITSSQLLKNSSVLINLDGATTVIINVVVDSCVSAPCAFSTSGVSFNDGNVTGYADNVLWNFINATEITFDGIFGGSILAPGADVTNNNQIDGTLVANSFEGGGEVHEHAFQGTLPTGTPTNTPEPASLALAATGVFALGVIKRRRRQHG